MPSQVLSLSLQQGEMQEGIDRVIASSCLLLLLLLVLLINWTSVGQETRLSLPALPSLPFIIITPLLGYYFSFPRP